MPWEMLQDLDDTPPQYKLNPKFIKVPASPRSPQKQHDISSPTLAVQQVRSLLSPASSPPEQEQEEQEVEQGKEKEVRRTEQQSSRVGAVEP